ncbi:hypothetical protein U9M48_012632 [Paspalum notatum var. saurae]|uniref:Reverse transcriptase n=1 Tax=Paspalum notatum var. saurae TaxID=547442 RepID=A0AAQ3SYM8_PASNO
MCTVFMTSRTHDLVLEHSKCLFGEWEVAYLGHFISNTGIAMDPSKMDVVRAWLLPCSVRALEGFLRYYKRFIHDYGVIFAPLTAYSSRRKLSSYRQQQTRHSKLTT